MVKPSVYAGISARHHQCTALREKKANAERRVARGSGSPLVLAPSCQPRIKGSGSRLKAARRSTATCQPTASYTMRESPPPTR